MGLRQYELKEVQEKYEGGPEEKGCGYKLPEISEVLKTFLKAYADEENLPGCFEECEMICKVEGIRELLDLRMLAKRTFLGDYFPAKVALRFENAFESPKVLKVTKPPRCVSSLRSLRTATECAAVHAGNQPSRERNGRPVFARRKAVDKLLPPEDDAGSGGGAVPTV